MRHVSQPPAPDALTLPGTIGVTERAAAIAHFQAPDWREREAEKSTKFKFTAYKADGVKPALEEAFHGLCAYCETRYGAGMPGVVDHYRPKGAVDTPAERRRPPGYYWLASSWDNLLPCCIRCNTAETHTYVDGTTTTSGKGTAFPLADEDARAERPGDEAGEEPLLLHPCHDDPAQHLEFVDELIRARNGSERGEATIRVLGLNRPHLLDDRRDQLLLARRARKRLGRALRKLEASPDDADAREDVDEAQEELEELLQRGKPYASMIAQFLGLT